MVVLNCQKNIEIKYSTLVSRQKKEDRDEICSSLSDNDAENHLRALAGTVDSPQAGLILATESTEAGADRQGSLPGRGDETVRQDMTQAERVTECIIIT